MCSAEERDEKESGSNEDGCWLEYRELQIHKALVSHYIVQSSGIDICKCFLL